MAQDIEVININNLPAASSTEVDTGQVLIVTGNRAKRANSSAMKGEKGGPGDKGDPGKTSQFDIGEVSKTPPGGTPSASLIKDGESVSGDPKYKLNLILPTGDTGPAPVIEEGDIRTGNPGTYVEVSLVTNGTTPEGANKYLLNMVIPRGEPGEGNGNVNFTDISGLIEGKKYFFIPGGNGSPEGLPSEWDGSSDKTSFEGVNTANGVSDLPVDKQLCVVSISSPGTFSVQAGLLLGRSVSYKLKNTTSGDITVSIPTIGGYEAKVVEITVPANRWSEVNIAHYENGIYTIMTEEG